MIHEVVGSIRFDEVPSGRDSANTSRNRATPVWADGSSPARILVRAPNWLGDVVMSTPGFHALRSAHPTAHIVALVPDALQPLLAGSEDFDEIWSMGSRGLRSLLDSSRRIASEGFDLGVAIPESISSALMMRLGGVGRIVGYARDPLRRALLHEAIPAAPEWGRRRLVSKERFVLKLMQALGADDSDPRLRLFVTAEEEGRLEEVFRRHRDERAALEPRRMVVLAPGASFGASKCWPMEYYARFADEMMARGEHVVLVGSASERDLIADLKNAMQGSPFDLAGELDLGMLKALLSRAKLLVANDAGARHIAAAFAVPSVIFFGPTSVAKTDQNLDRVEVLETEHGCRPCYLRECPIDHRCLRAITVREALVAADRALAAAGSAEMANENALRRSRGPA